MKNDLPIRGSAVPHTAQAGTSASLPLPALAEAPASLPEPQTDNYTNQVQVPAVGTDPIDAMFDSAPDALAKVNQVPPEHALARLFPSPGVDLDESEETNISIYVEAREVLGPSSAVALICAPNCPFRMKCPLFSIGKAPFGAQCPFETGYLVTRFGKWMTELGMTEKNMTETARVCISALAVADIQELRLLSILASPERAHMTSQVVRDRDIESGLPLAYEDVPAPEMQILRDIHEKRRSILNDFNLTPAAAAKAVKAMALLGKNTDMARSHSNWADRIRRASITVEAVPMKEEI